MTQTRTSVPQVPLKRTPAGKVRISSASGRIIGTFPAVAISDQVVGNERWINYQFTFIAETDFPISPYGVLLVEDREPIVGYLSVSQTDIPQGSTVTITVKAKLKV